MANLYLGQYVANKIERKLTAAHIVAISYSLLLAVRMRRYVSLDNINPLVKPCVLPSNGRQRSLMPFEQKLRTYFCLPGSFAYYLFWSQSYTAVHIALKKGVRRTISFMDLAHYC